MRPSLYVFSDPDDPERSREFMKSVEVREDMKAMEARKRVSEILNSKAFRDELEDIMESQVSFLQVNHTMSLRVTEIPLLFSHQKCQHVVNWILYQLLCFVQCFNVFPTGIIITETKSPFCHTDFKIISE